MRVIYCWFNQRRQLHDRLTPGLAKVFQFLPVREPGKGSAYIEAGLPELDVISSICHEVLDTFNVKQERVDGKKKADPYQRQEDNHAEAGGGGWRHARDQLREIRDLDGCT